MLGVSYGIYDNGEALVEAYDGLQIVGIDLHRRGSVLVRVNGGFEFEFDPTLLQHKVSPHQRLAVNGLTYHDVPERSLLNVGGSCCGMVPLALRRSRISS